MIGDIKLTEAWKYLIKPERINYSIENLGPWVIQFRDYDSYRKDFYFINKLGFKIQCSLFIPQRKKNKQVEIQPTELSCPCVVYCHSQSGNRLEGLFLQNFCIQNNYGLCLFDFSSCGKSEGEYVTLGWREHEDLSQLVSILIKDYKATQISLWGWSMGAVTCVLYCQRNNMHVSSMVLDSPFSDIEVMVKDVAYQKISLPGFVVSMLMKYMSSQIHKKLRFNILQLKPIQFVKDCCVPCVFIIGQSDELVLPKRIDEMHKAYGGNQKWTFFSQGDHASEREPKILNSCMEIIYDEFKKNLLNTKKKQQDQRVFIDLKGESFFNKMASNFEDKLQEQLSKQQSHLFGITQQQKKEDFVYQFDLKQIQSVNQDLYEENLQQYEQLDDPEVEECEDVYAMEKEMLNISSEDYNKSISLYKNLQKY